MTLTAGRTGAALALGLHLLLAPALRAQDSVIVIDPDAPPVDTLMRGGPPPDVVAELIAFYNDSATTRTVGDVSFPAGSSFEGRLAALSGNRTHSGPGPGTHRRRERHPAPATGRGRGG